MCVCVCTGAATDVSRGKVRDTRDSGGGVLPVTESHVWKLSCLGHLNSLVRGSQNHVRRNIVFDE